MKLQESNRQAALGRASQRRGSFFWTLAQKHEGGSLAILGSPARKRQTLTYLTPYEEDSPTEENRFIRVRQHEVGASLYPNSRPQSV